MELLARMAEHDHEQVIAVQNRATGLRGFLALHDTTRGPALGGVRVRPYPGEAEALADVLRLSRAMTYKAALAELPCGGGKVVVLDHPGLERAAAFDFLGALIESLGGRFFAGRDLGVTDDDLRVLARRTGYVACGLAPGLGNISEHTALGVWHGLRACLDACGVQRARIALQGVGDVGAFLARLLKREGMQLILADTRAERAERLARELGARVAAPEDILFVDCDVVAPCAVGGVINRQTAPRLAARIICGSANNVLDAPETADMLRERSVLYAPDYLVNAGGLIRGAEFYLLKRKDSRPSLARIYDRMKQVLELARSRGLSTARVADQLAEARLPRMLRGLRRGKSGTDLHWGGDPPAAAGDVARPSGPR